jgi:hypothetical protein
VTLRRGPALRPGPVLAALALLACNRAGREGEEHRASVVELRNAQGALELAIQRTSDGFRWVDAKEGEGRMVASGGVLRGVDGKRGPFETQTGSAGALDVRGPGGFLLRLKEVDGLLRLGDGNGIPLARVSSQPDEASAYDAGGMMVARARRAGGRIAIANRDGATTAFVVGEVPLERAALAVLPALTASERAVLLLAGR